jgi:ATP-dependent Clp protease adapter protein ClpS
LEGTSFAEGEFSMNDVQADIRHREIIFHDDDKTPLPFLIELLRSVFKKPLADAYRFVEAIRMEGKSSCGSYPRDIAAELLRPLDSASMKQAIRFASPPGQAWRTTRCLRPAANSAAIFTATACH